jgi:hypothetical protein
MHARGCVVSFVKVLSSLAGLRQAPHCCTAPHVANHGHLLTLTRLVLQGCHCLRAQALHYNRPVTNRTKRRQQEQLGIGTISNDDNVIILILILL